MDNRKIVHYVNQIMNITVANGFSELEEKIYRERAEKLIKDYDIPLSSIKQPVIEQKIPQSNPIPKSNIGLDCFFEKINPKYKSFFDKWANIINPLLIIFGIMIPFTIWFHTSLCWSLIYLGIDYSLKSPVAYAFSVIIMLMAFYKDKTIPFLVCGMGTIIKIISIL